jgi:BirA family transcriptional regulator, biotin operon repressor / biotin---[acetyl-CoA-carboxylase] ligase
MSTNSALLDRARAVTDTQPDTGGAQVRRSVESGAFGRRSIDLQPCLLIAEHQSGGRGRLGRVWQSVAGASLTFSLALPLALADWSGMSLAVGVALCEALEGALPASSTTRSASGASYPRLGLKWPNDLWLMSSPCEGRKLGGILIETVPAGAQRLAVIGIGLNVMPFEAIEANTGFAALRELDNAATAPGVIAQIALPLVQALKLFEREGFAAFEDRFAARDVLRGQNVRTTLADMQEGVARGVSAQGELLVQTNDGIVKVSSGEVSVRFAGASRDASGPASAASPGPA